MQVRICALGWPQRFTRLLCAIAAICLTACGTGGSDDSAPQQGRLLLGKVQGVDFRTDTQQGTLDADGRYHYRVGETVRFSVGGIELGTTASGASTEPQRLLGGSAELNDKRLINIVRLLISLDQDGNLANGIVIDTATKTAITNFVRAKSGWSLPLNDTPAFDAALTGPEGLLTTLSTDRVTPALQEHGTKVLVDPLFAWRHLQDSLDVAAGKAVDYTVKPLLFIHGGAGSASQFESQSERYVANGYPRTYLGTYEYNTYTDQDAMNAEQAAVRNVQVNAIIDTLRRISGSDKITLSGHSNGTRVSLMYLGHEAHARKVSRYVSIDGQPLDAPPGGVPTLAIWGQYVTGEIKGAENVYPPVGAPVGHIQAATSADTFARMFRFYNDRAPTMHEAPAATGETVWIAGRALIFPQNFGADGTTLAVYEVNRTTGMRVAAQTVHEQAIGVTGDWGPFALKKNVAYEFALLREGAGNNQHYYREPFKRDNDLIRLNTSVPGTGVGQYLHRSANHTNLMIGRDKELWGDQGTSNDVLTINGTSVLTSTNAALLKRLSVFFVHDRNRDRASNLAVPDGVFHLLPFMSGVDLYLPAAATPDTTLSLVLTPRGEGGVQQVINVPNWASDQVRSVSVQFRDHVN